MFQLSKIESKIVKRKWSLICLNYSVAKFSYLYLAFIRDRIDKIGNNYLVRVFKTLIKKGNKRIYNKTIIFLIKIWYVFKKQKHGYYGHYLHQNNQNIHIVILGKKDRVLWWLNYIFIPSNYSYLWKDYK